MAEVDEAADDAAGSRRRTASKAEDITIEYCEGDVCLVKELKKEILSRGGWSTVMFLYQDFDRKTGGYREPKISIRRYQKVGGAYVQRSKFTISSAQQATTIAGILREWTGALLAANGESAPA
ncbi:MAG TPA: hypothetical protein PKM88_06000 [bacterium]|nr:hypothetical protein [bacterium]